MLKFRWEKDFKQTEIGEVPREWEVRKIKEFARRKGLFICQMKLSEIKESILPQRRINKKELSRLMASRFPEPFSPLSNSPTPPLLGRLNARILLRPLFSVHPFITASIAFKFSSGFWLLSHGYLPSEALKALQKLLNLHFSHFSPLG